MQKDNMDKTDILSGVEDTLYIPLAARIYATEHFPDFFYDEKALSLKKHIPTDSIDSNTTEYFYMASVCRQWTIDKKIVRFLSLHKQCNVVFLGAGLETAYHRIHNTRANFYQVDLPNVIDVRKRALGKGENESLIAGDMFALDWIKELDISLPTLIVVSGVYQYFKQQQVVGMIQKMKSMIPTGELIFDATNSSGLRLANKYVRKTGNKNAQMYFFIDEPREFARSTGTELLDVEGFFAGALRHCKGLKLMTKIYMYFADKLHRTMVFHFKFNA